MPHSFLDLHEVIPGVVEMQTEGMAQAVQGISLVSQANPRKSLGEDVRHSLLANVGAGKLAGEQPIIGLGSLVALMDIGDEILHRPVRQNGLAVGAVLSVSNVDVLFLAMDVMAMKRAHLTDPHAGRVQENDLSLVLGINDGVNDGIHFITGRYFGELLDDTERRNLTTIPILMKDVIIEVPQNGDVDVDGAGFQPLYIVSNTKCIVIFINQLREKVGVMYGNPETTTGGKALKFYASIRIDVRKSETIKEGKEVVGNRTKINIVKNKVAPPFRSCVVDMLYGEGISKLGEILDYAVESDLIHKSGSFYSYDNDKIGQGRDNAKQWLKSHPEERSIIEEKIREELLKNPFLVSEEQPDSIGSEEDEDEEFELDKDTSATSEQAETSSSDNESYQEFIEGVDREAAS